MRIPLYLVQREVCVLDTLPLATRWQLRGLLSLRQTSQELPSDTRLCFQGRTDPVSVAVCHPSLSAVQGIITKTLVETLSYSPNTFPLWSHKWNSSSHKHPHPWYLECLYMCLRHLWLMEGRSGVYLRFLQDSLICKLVEHMIWWSQGSLLT